MSGLTVSSAGTRAVIGVAIHKEAAAVLSELGGSPARFSARQLTAKIATEADLILTMSQEHRNMVLEFAPRKLSRTYTLREASNLASEFDARTVADLVELRPRLDASQRADVADPIGQSSAVFARVGADIAALLPPVMELCRRSL